MPKVGLNPYALGLRLFEHIEEMENKGRFSLDYFRLHDAVARKTFDRKKNTGRDVIFSVRENMEDFSFINTFVDQEFMDRHRLFLAGKRFNPQRSTWQYYIKSRKVADYRQMIINTLYHPPDIRVIEEKTRDGVLYLDHRFENKPLKQDYIENTMIGIEFLWGGRCTWKPVFRQPKPGREPSMPISGIREQGPAGRSPGHSPFNGNGSGL